MVVWVRHDGRTRFRCAGPQNGHPDTAIFGERSRGFKILPAEKNRRIGATDARHPGLDPGSIFGAGADGFRPFAVAAAGMETRPNAKERTYGISEEHTSELQPIMCIS